MKCPRCNSDRVNVTKRNEKVSHFGATLNNELVAICQECGKSFDPELAYLKQKVSEAKQNLADICTQKLQNILEVEDLGFAVPKFPYGFFATPDIPGKKLINAISTYAPSAKKEEILFLADLSIFGSAKAGVLITPQTIYYKNLGKSHTIDLNTIHNCNAKRSKLIVNDLTLELNSGAMTEMLMNIIRILAEKCNNATSVPADENKIRVEHIATQNNIASGKEENSFEIKREDIPNSPTNIAEPKNKTKSIKKWGCGCASVFAVFFILIGIIGSFAEVEETTSPKEEKSRTSQAVPKTQESDIKIVSDNKKSHAPKVEKNENSAQSEGDKMQSEIERYYDEAQKMRSLAKSITAKDKVLSEKELLNLKNKVLKEHFQFHEDNPKKVVILQEEYCAETRNRAANLLQTYNTLKRKHSQLLKQNSSSYEISQTAKKINLFVDQIKKAQQEIVMQDAILDLKKAAYELLTTLCGPDMEKNLANQRNNKKMSALEFFKKIRITCKMKVISKDGYTGKPQFTFSIANNSNVAIDVIEGNLRLKRRNGEQLIMEKEFLVLRADGDFVAAGKMRTFSPDTAKIFLIEDGWDRLFVVNDYVLEFEPTRIRTVKSPNSDAVEYDISE